MLSMIIQVCCRCEFVKIIRNDRGKASLSEALGKSSGTGK
jgi:hypothetical protein